MKQSIFILFFILSYSTVLGQDDTLKYWDVNKADPFNNVHCPINDGFSMWLMRQNMMVSGHATVLEYNNIYSVKLKTYSPEYRIETYMPIIQASKINMVLGTRYWKMSMVPEEKEIDKTVQFVWLYTILQYKASERLNLVWSVEGYQKGNETTFHEVEGNKVFTALYGGYALNKHWQLIGFGVYQQLWKHEEMKRSFLGGLQVKWLPTKNIKLMTGMPIILAGENSFGKLDLSASFWYNMKGIGFVRYRLTDKAGLSLIFRNNDLYSNDLFFESQTKSFDNKDYTYNNITQFQQRLTVEFGFKCTANTSVQFNFGRILGSDTDYNMDDKNIRSSQNGDGWMGGVSFYFLNL